VVRVLDLDASKYVRHTLHADDRVWVEKNCYVDIWIEVIHAVGCEPLAIAPFVVALDFEGDQWTFFKPPHNELWDLYGIDVQELNCWKPLLDHAIEHLGAGKLISAEADAWWLPDTSGTDYRRQHTKSTIVLNDLDVDGKRLGYWHNAGYFTLEGEDFVETFKDREMRFYAELVRIDRVVRRPEAELRAMSGKLLGRHLARRPREHPIPKFAARFARDLPQMQQLGLPYYHTWAFATVRQLGAAAELLAAHLTWLAGEDGGQFAPAIAAYTTISTGAKSFILKAARAVNSKKPFDPSATFDEWARAWDAAIATLEQHAD
jgi:hypothetical protein